MMSFQTLDWNAEAARIAAAFGIRKECSFRSGTAPSTRVLCVRNWLFYDTPMLNAQIELCVIYSTHDRLFELHALKSEQFDCAAISLAWDGSVKHGEADALLSRILARGLCNLDLLTPEVEETLELSLTAHERLEWMTASEARTRNEL